MAGLFGAGLLACVPPGPVEQKPEPIRTPTPSASATPNRPATGSTEVFGFTALRGVAYNAQSSPLPGLEVELESRESKRPYWRRIPVSEAGAYVFTNVPILAGLRLSAHLPGEREALRTLMVTAIRSANEFRVVNLGGLNSSEDPAASNHFIPTPSPEASASAPSPLPSLSPSPSPLPSPSPSSRAE